MMIWPMLLWMFACGEEPVTTHPEANKRTAKAACKLFEGAGQACTANDKTITAAGRTLQVEVVYSDVNKAMGAVNFQGVVKLAGDGDTWLMPIRGFGMNPVEALDRGVHEWAVVSGVAVVDRILDQPNLPALAAVDKEDIAPLVVENRRVWRGWTRLGGADPIDHQVFASKLAEHVPGKAVVSIVVARDLSEVLSAKAYVDGSRSAPVEAWLNKQPWKKKGVFELRQTYLLE